MGYYCLKNQWIKAVFIDRGATIISLKYFKDGQWLETLATFDHHHDYLDNPYYLNCVCGPHAGRISEGKYSIGKRQYMLSQNDGINNLHSGPNGYNTVDFIGKATGDRLEFTHQDPDGIDVKITYLLDGQRLHIDMQAIPIRSALLNLTQHTYFNLDQAATIETIEMQITSKKVAALNISGAPNGEFIAVNQGVFDFNHKKKIGNIIKSGAHPQFSISKHIDHPYAIERWPIILYSPQHRYGVKIRSDADYAVVYLGASFDGRRMLKSIGAARPFSAIAIEPQNLPNEISWDPNTKQIYDAGTMFHRSIVYTLFSD